LQLKTHSKIALGYFLIIAFLGLILRFFHIIDIPINYKHIVHAHSHIALLGWIYTALTTLIYFIYLKDKPITKTYQIIFWSTQITLIGMLLSFPFIGYALFSILFSTLFLIASYVFFWFVNKHVSDTQKKTDSYQLIKIALWFMVLSSIGPWSLGIIMNTLGGGSIWYRISIYFYLHFQYNGWFIVTLFGILFYILEQNNIAVSKKHFQLFYWTLITSILLTFFLSVLWTKPHLVFYVFGTIGAVLQLISFGIFAVIYNQNRIKIKNVFSPFLSKILKLVGLLFIVKMILQLVGSFPYFSSIIATNLDLVIGYLHWTFLGVVSIALFAYLHYFKLIYLSKKTVVIYTIGFFTTEILLFYRGYLHWQNKSVFENYNLFLAVASALLFIAILLLFSVQFKKKIR